MRNMISLLSMSVLLIAHSKVHSQTAGSQETKTVKMQLAKFQQAVLAHDTITLAELYSADAVSLVHNIPMLTGIDTILQRWKKSFTLPYQLNLEAQKIEIPTRHLATCFGIFSVYDSSGKEIANGKWLQLWQKQKGVWKISLEMDNFNSKPK